MSELSSSTTEAVAGHLGGRGFEIKAENFGWHHAERSEPALSGLNLLIPAGQKVLLLGPSGAGKSTLLHALAGVLEIDERQQATGELQIQRQNAFARRFPVGLMQQDPETQIVQSRVGDDVAFGAENLGMAPELIRSRIPEVLRAVGLGNLDLAHRTQELSGGQKQRLALAGILAMGPGLMLLDEPTANIDPSGIEPLRDAVIAAANDTGATLLVVEHRLQAWAEHVDRVLVLAPGGGIAHDLAPRALFENEQIRRELASSGIWIPGYVPHTDPIGSRVGQELLGTVKLRAARNAQAERTAETNMQLHAGQALVIHGENGAGKSTLALTIGGLLEPSAGRVEASDALADGLGRYPFQWRAGALVARIGSVFQEPEHQFVTQSVREELAFAPTRARLAGVADEKYVPEQITLRVDELLHRLGLTHLEDANPFTLSGGEKRRLSVATVLAASPDVLILDEPTFGQDANTWRELANILIEALEAGIAVVAVTHDEDFAHALNAEQIVLTRDQSGAELEQVRQGTMLDAPLGRSWLAKINPLAKLGAVAGATLPLISTIDWISACVVILATLFALPLAGLRLGAFMRRGWPLIVAGALAAWGIALVGEDSGETLLNLGILSITEGSVSAGVATGLRTLALAVPTVLLLSSTNPSDLGGALAQQLKVPHRFVLGALAGMRLLGLLVEEFTTLTLARRARGVGDLRSPVQRVKAKLGQVLALLVQALRRAGRLAVTMEAKGFGTGPRTWVRAATFTWLDGTVLATGVLLGILAIGAALWAGTFNLVWS
ncbi:ATP-binding cassette domain-containing protein [Glutamicibacter arilaitensis]|uniref:ATP-binding cassette domain-containing protein n=1 Tax=Glutamicibacter arilaitensis TaxID=256701 RepID=UPI00384F78DD